MMKVVIAGAGYAARYYTKALPEMGHKIAGISNRTRSRGEELANEVDAKYYPSLQEMIECEDADVLVIATATENHINDIRVATENGVKWVFCEKPAGSTVEETKEIKAIAKANGMTVGVGYKMRYEPVFHAAKRLIDEGRIGNVYQISMNFFQTIPHSEWFLQQGFLTETMAHPFDLASWFAGSTPQKATCHTDHLLGKQGEDRVSVHIRYGDNITATLNGGWVEHYPFIAGRKNICFEIVGTGGYICGVRPDYLMICDDEGLRKVELEPTDIIKAEFQDFVDCVTAGKKASIGIEDALYVQKLIEASKESVKQGTEIALNI